jgi:hypothetical protein
MPHSFNRLYTRHTPEQVFGFVSDFRHAALWDPRTRSVEKLTDGPVRQGTRFMLLGKFLWQTLKLPYEIAVYSPLERVVFEGSTSLMSYREQVDFKPDGAGTCIEYGAELTLRSVLAITSPIMSLLYQRIADDATSGIVPALDRALSAAPRAA